MSSNGGKQYGLIIPKKQQPVTPSASNIFADDDGSDEDDGTDWVKKALKAEGEKNKMKKQTKLSMQKALKEDPTIYQYDEVYDDMERTNNQLKTAKQEEQKKPKYIRNLLKAAERRKKEQEHRIERMVQKEREAEGNMYADKESFVTSAYRAKLEEFKKMEEEESRMDRLEAIGDVTKQQDMSGFYRHLYAQTVENPKEVEDAAESRTLNTNNENESVNNSPKKIDNVDDNTSSVKEVNVAASNKEKGISTKSKKGRQYRQRVMEEEESDDEPETRQNVQIKNTDKDEDKTLLPVKKKGSDTIEMDEPTAKRQRQENEELITDTQHNENTRENTCPPDSKNSQQVLEDNKDSNKVNKSDDSVCVKSAPEKKKKSYIWEKRTVGPVFEAALQRYYARKAMRVLLHI